jgi:hypothetical protein
MRRCKMAMYEPAPIKAQSSEPLDPDDNSIGGDVIDPGMPDDSTRKGEVENPAG